MSGSRGKSAADELRRVLNAAGSLAADFIECLNRTAEIGAARMPSRKIFRPQNCGAAAHTLPATGRDDPRLSRLYNRFYGAAGDPDCWPFPVARAAGCGCHGGARPARLAAVIDNGTLEHRTYCKVAIIWDHPD